MAHAKVSNNRTSDHKVWSVRYCSTKMRYSSGMLGSRSIEISNKTSHRLQNLINYLEKHKEKISSAQSFFLKPITINGEVIRWETLQAHLAKPRALKLRDKIAFVVGVLNICIMSLVLGMAPYMLPTLYTVKLFALLPVRLLLYKRKRWHYYLFEMCYLVNLLFTLVLLVPLKSPFIFYSIWGLANGPMLLAVATMKNSLVFHSLDKITSVMIHFDCPLTLFALRWLIDYDNIKSKSYLSSHLHKIVTHYPSVSLINIIIPSILLYLTWQLLYWIFIWEMKAEKIKSGHQTTLSRVIEERDNLYHKLTLVFGIKWQPYLFVLFQFLYTILLVPLAALMLNNIYIHMATLFTSFFIAIYNGANYYLEVLAPKNNRNSSSCTKCSESDCKRH